MKPVRVGPILSLQGAFSSSAPAAMCPRRCGSGAQGGRRDGAVLRGRSDSGARRGVELVLLK